MNKFEQHISNMHGAKAKPWLDSLPKLVAKYSSLWALNDLVACENLSYNYVLSGMQGQLPIILKIGMEADAIAREVAALEAFAGFGAVKVIAANLNDSVMLIERAVTGITLKTLIPQQDSQAVEIACSIIEQLHKGPIPANSNFPLLTDWLNIIEHDWEIPKQHLLLARNLKQQLLAQSTDLVLLHGDLHYDNILANNNGWVVIDPKGVVGDPIFDKIGTLVREPLSELLALPDVDAIIQRRVLQIANYFKLDPELILKWTYLHTVMAICWCIEDNQDYGMMLKFLSKI